MTEGKGGGEKMLGVDTGMIEQTSLFDYDGQEYKISSSLIGKDCLFGGKFEDYNGELLAALREGWLETNGLLTKKGEEELDRRKKNMTEYERGKMAAAEKRMMTKAAGKQAPERRQVKDKKALLGEVLEAVGYKGEWKLKTDKRTPGGFFIIFSKTEGQIEEGKVIAKDSLDDLIEYIRTELPKMLKKNKYVRK